MSIVGMKRLVAAGAVIAGYALCAAEPSYETLICHRGESVDAPENTLPAYKMAVERGFGFECDIYKSKDGRCFTFHDGRLTRTTDGANTNVCGDVAWDEISKLDVGGWGKWKGSEFAGTRPALLEEVLELARDGRRIYVELKGGRTMVPEVKKAVESQHTANPSNILFISFIESGCMELKRVMPEYKVFLLLYARRKCGDGKFYAYTPEEIIKKAKALGVDGVDILFDAEVHTKEFIDEVKAAGLEFHVWTIDNPVKTLLAFCRGADTVTTNCAKSQLDTIARESR